MRNVFRHAALFVALAAMGSAALAQEPAAIANPWAQVSKVTVHPGAFAEFEDYIKKLNSGRTKLGLPQQVFTWQLALGGSPFEYHIVAPFDRWEEMDAAPTVPAIATKAYGEVDGAKLLKVGRSAIAAIETEVFRLRLDLSTNAKLGPPPKLVSVTRTEHNRDTAASYLRLLAKIKKAEEQDSNAPPVFRYVLAFGDGLVTLAVRPSETHAERGKWPNQTQVLRKAYGEAEQLEMSEAFTKSIAKRSTVVFAYRPDLSKVSAP